MAGPSPSLPPSLPHAAAIIVITAAVIVGRSFDPFSIFSLPPPVRAHLPPPPLKPQSGHPNRRENERRRRAAFDAAASAKAVDQVCVVDWRRQAAGYLSASGGSGATGHTCVCHPQGGPRALPAPYRGNSPH